MVCMPMSTSLEADRPFLSGYPYSCGVSGQETECLPKLEAIIERGTDAMTRKTTTMASMAFEVPLSSSKLTLISLDFSLA